MTDRERNILNMFINTVQFDLLNAGDYAELAEAAANFTIVRGVITALETHSAEQTSGTGGRAVEQKALLRSSIRRKMKRFSRTARALDLNDEGFRRLFRIPDENNDQRLLSTAREFVTEAVRFKAEFARYGIPASLADGLNADIEAMETAMNVKASAQIEGTGTTAAIETEIQKGMKAAKILDSVMKNVYDENPVKLAEWQTARHIRRLNGTTRAAETQVTTV